MNSTESSLYLPCHAHLFSWIDYSVFGLMLSVSTGIGIYFGCLKKKPQTADDYLMGGKRMKTIPIAVSLVASQISTTTLLAVPADVYKFGGNYMWVSISTVIVSIIAYYVYLPVFFKLQTTSIFEYLKLRFDKKIQFLASFFRALAMLVFCPIVIYVPALAFSLVSGVNVQLIAVITSVVCIFYTAIGGLKAVVWTDMFQFFVMIVTFVIIFFIGLSEVGGFGVLWSRAKQSGRLDILDFSFDPTLRDSFSALIIGGTFQWISFTGTDPGFVQKFLSVPTFKDAKNVIFIYTILMSSLHIFAVFLGLLLYAKYWDCDPLTSQQISRLEQLVPQFVMEVSGTLNGLPGFFIAGVFSAGLSSLSAVLNSMSAVVYKDFVYPFVPKTASQKRISNLLKIIVVVIGCISTLLVLVVDKVSGIFPFYITLTAISTGPLVGLFSLGILFPSGNSKGALYGSILSTIIITWIALENYWCQNHGLNNEFLKPVSIDGCNRTTQNTLFNVIKFEKPFFLFRISFWFYTMIGSILTVVFGLLISYFTKHDKAPVPEKLLSPVIYSLLTRSSRVIESKGLSNEKEVQLEETSLQQ